MRFIPYARLHKKPIWSYMKLSGAIWSYLELSGATCYLQLPAIWSYLALSAAVCGHVEPSGAISSHLEISAAIWTYPQVSGQTYNPPKTQTEKHKPTIQNPKDTNQHNPNSFSSQAHRLSRQPLQNQPCIFNLPAKIADHCDCW